MMKVKIGTEEREIVFDLDVITVEEYRNLFSPKTTVASEDELIQRVTGITPDEYKKLTVKDQKRLFQNFIKTAREPLSDPS